MTLKIKILVINYNDLHLNKKSIMGVISNTFLITVAYSFIVGLDSAALYLATDSSAKNKCNIVTKGGRFPTVIRSYRR